MNKEFFIERKLAAIERALTRLYPRASSCCLCPRCCQVNRLNRQTGVCQTGDQARVSTSLLHYGEEPVLSGQGGQSSAPGSGTIFFAGCNLKCLFCQNYQLSWLNQGELVSDEQLAGFMLNLQAQGALNINLVSPTHVILPVLRALRIAYSRGLTIPIVYNSNGYDSIEVIEELRGIVDIYLPDLKYMSSELSKKYSAAPDYFEQAHLAIEEMYCQQPELILNNEDIATRGLIIRHLVLPGHSEDSLEIVDWIAKNLSTTVGLSLMSQYHPCFRAPAELQREVSRQEYQKVMSRAASYNFSYLFLQPEPFQSEEHLLPDFGQRTPFRWK
ncbi:MAG TPA: radical SAM protein [Candidatus Saccharicenans sp.]|nr:radical SAM protein [Candidatus Saccharicenans sp.]HQM74277.1 radical SAM protein [Candidatus Saccharicenans sp.]